MPRNTPRYIIRLETGKPTFKVEILKANLPLLSRILNSDLNSVIREAYDTIKQVSNHATGSNPASVGWFCQLHALLGDLGHQHLLDSENADQIRQSQDTLVYALVNQTRNIDLESASHSSTIPHYGSLKNLDILVEPHLNNILPTYLATTVAQMRLGYSSMYNKGVWYKLGGMVNTPCRFCGEPETLYHAVESCSGHDLDRTTLMPKYTKGEDILKYIYDPAADKNDLLQLYLLIWPDVESQQM